MSINKTESKTYFKEALILFFIVILFFLVIHSQKTHARILEFAGIVTSIEWKSNNHNLPRIIILEESGKIITISHPTIKLDKSNLKIGDKIVKKFDSDYCLINGEKVKFSKY